MSRADYEAFKERMREWMLEHADAYDAFEEMMNYESDEGYRLVMTTAMKLLPKFAKAAAKQMSTRGAIDVDAVIAQCSGSNWHKRLSPNSTRTPRTPTPLFLR